MVLKKINRALKLNGLLCLDTINVKRLLKNFLALNIMEKGKDLMIDRTEFDKSTNRIINKRIVIRNGIRKDKPFSIRIYSLSEIRKLLKDADFSIIDVYGSFTGEPLKADSKRMIIIARKIRG